MPAVLRSLARARPVSSRPRAAGRGLASLAAFLVLSLSSCSVLDAQQAAPVPDPSLGVPRADATLRAEVPAALRQAGVLDVGTGDATAPMEFTPADGLGGQPGGSTVAAHGDVVGADVDLVNAVAAKLGLTTRWTPTDVDTIIDKVQDGTFDLGVAALTVTTDREERATMVSYLAAGTLWVVPRANPRHVTPDQACGSTVAVRAGTVQAEVDLPTRNRSCAAGSKIEIVAFPSQDDATAAVLAGRADATVSDSPVAHHIVAENPGLTTVGRVYDVAPYGIAVPRGQQDLAAAVAGALKALHDDGSYDAILQKWDIGPGIAEFEVDPETS